MSTPSSRADDEVAAVRALLRVARRFERESSVLSLSDYRVLAAVLEGEQRASRVAARLALGKPAISSIVEKLTTAGLLTREQSSEDRRAMTLDLTPAGRSAFATFESHLLDQVRELCSLTPDPALTLQVLGWLGPALDSTQVGSGTRTRSEKERRESDSAIARAR